MSFEEPTEPRICEKSRSGFVGWDQKNAGVGTRGFRGGFVEGSWLLAVM